MAASMELTVFDTPFEGQRAAGIIHPQEAQRGQDFEMRQVAKDSHFQIESSTISKDACRRKRVNRAARLKQWKLDARREQWLAQVSGKFSKSDQQPRQTSSIEGNLDVKMIPTESPTCASSREKKVINGESTNFNSLDGHDRPRAEKETDRTNVVEQELGSDMVPPGSDIGHKDNKTKIWCSSILGSEDLIATADKLDPSAASSVSSSTLLACDNKLNGNDRDFFKGEVWPFRRGEGDISETIENDSLLQHSSGDLSIKSSNVSSPTKPRSGNSIGTRTSISSSNSSFGASSSEEDNDTRNVEDDWEAAADALHMQASLQDTCEPAKSQGQSDCLELPRGEELSMNKTVVVSSSDLQTGILKPEYKCKSSHFGTKVRDMGRAWRPDDVSRPSTLPRLGKQHSFPMHSGKPTWGIVNSNVWGPPPTPTYCPICTEELDMTDSSFVPCSCGFRLCLFCHHKISLDDGRCPGCRKLYNSDVSMKLSRSSTIRPRS